MKKLASKSFDILAKSVNGEIFEVPKVIQVRCGELTPVGMANVKTYDEKNCIVVHKLYLIRRGLDVFGTEQFSSIEEFESYVNRFCVRCSTPCLLKYNDCPIVYNDCKIRVFV